MKMGLLYKELSYKIRGCIFEVYNNIGPGFREETYKKAMQIELNNKEIDFETEKDIDIHYKDKKIDEYRLDLVVDNRIILELKAVSEMHPKYEAQLLSYLKASELKVGFLVNFGSDKLFIKRYINPNIKRIDL
jgi:GxxExxY protein